MTGTMNNARQLYIAQFQMSNDGAATGDSTSAWPGDLPVVPATLLDYLNVLLGKGYLKGADALKLESAPGANLTGVIQPQTSTQPEAFTALGGISALKVYLDQDANPATTIFCVTQNYVYNTALAGNSNPYGSNGFIVVKKGGDAAIFRSGQALATAWPSAVIFQTQVGMMPGDTENTVGAEPATTLKYP
jgi:hypothetical protein